MTDAKSKLPAAKLLIVDDDQAVYSPISLLLAHYEFEVTVSTTLADGLKQLNSDPLVVVLDLQLPDGNGLSLLEHVRMTGKKAKVFVLCSDLRPEVVRKVRRFVPERSLQSPQFLCDSGRHPNCYECDRRNTGQIRRLNFNLYARG